MSQFLSTTISVSSREKNHWDVRSFNAARLLAMERLHAGHGHTSVSWKKEIQANTNRCFYIAG